MQAALAAQHCPYFTPLLPWIQPKRKASSEAFLWRPLAVAAVIAAGVAFAMFMVMAARSLVVLGQFASKQRRHSRVSLAVYAGVKPDVRLL